MTKLEILKHAIAIREGFYVKSSVPSRFNNPGDLMYAGQAGALPITVIGKDGKKRIYAKFPGIEEGWDALEHQVRLDAARGLTLQQFIHKYAPAADANDESSYLAFVMRALQVKDPETRLSAALHDA